jgi:hypothetical protein
MAAKNVVIQLTPDQQRQILAATGKKLGTLNIAISPPQGVDPASIAFQKVKVADPTALNVVAIKPW